MHVSHASERRKSSGRYRFIEGKRQKKKRKVDSRMAIVGEKVTSTSRPNRSITNSRDRSVCVRERVCVCFSKLKPDLRNPKKEWQDNRRPILSHSCSSFLSIPHCFILHCHSQQVASGNRNRAAWKSDMHAYGNTGRQELMHAGTSGCSSAVQLGYNGHSSLVESVSVRT